MKRKVFVSTPSRICLFGEHQDYLGLEVIASAIDLRFSAAAVERSDQLINIKIRDISLDYLGANNLTGKYQEKVIDLSQPIVYEGARDYLKSAIKVLIKEGYPLVHGYDIVMDSEIPIGKGMSSSTTMIMALIKVLMEMMEVEDKDNPEKLALLGFKAEVQEFGEPGGMMDHYTSALGGLVHLSFHNNRAYINKIDKEIPGSFILFDSLAGKDTIRVLSNAKTPVISALKKLEHKGISSIRDFVNDEGNMKYLDILDETERVKLKASIDNYRILKEAESILNGDNFVPERFGKLLKDHHTNLRDGLDISTPAIEKILQTAYQNGALGGKINGSGGGGCAFVYAFDEDCDRIIDAVAELGYPGRLIRQDSGIRKDGEEKIEVWYE